jgi:hypothetical protein
VVRIRHLDTHENQRSDILAAFERSENEEQIQGNYSTHYQKMACEPVMILSFVGVTD